MKDHYAIVELDARNNVKDVRIRIDNTMYLCDVHDAGSGARTVMVHIESMRPVKPHLLGPTGRELLLAQARERLQKMYEKGRI